MLTREGFFIGGEWVAPTGSEWLEVVSPTTEERIGRVPVSTTHDVDAAVRAARSAFDEGPWPRMRVEERGEYLLRMAQLLEPRIEEITRLQIDEMGSPYSFIRATTAASLASVRRELKVASAIAPVEVRDGTVGKIVVRRDPVGVSAGIIPWNGPVALAVGKLVPSLLAGCPVIIKPAPETPLSAYVIADALAELGLPDGVFNLVPGGREVGEHLVTHRGIDRVSFTGSSAAGARVASLCAERFKPATLELGGKSAAVVLADVDLEVTMPQLLASAFSNNGQVCHATTRILVSLDRYEEFLERLIDSVSKMRVGDPHKEDTDIGPLVAERQRDRVEAYIASGVEENATLAIGGERPAGLHSGWFVEPTVFVDVASSMRIAREEIFGPVVCVIRYEDEAEAVAIANDSDYGLGGAVFTQDVEHGLKIAAQIKTGVCRINDGPAAGGGGPFGGIKRSGIGRERDREGYESYFNLKAISLPPTYVPEAAVR